MCETEVATAYGLRTWVCTFTFGREKLPETGLVAYCKEQLTNFFKRLRERGSSFRYLAVMELQTDGTPHFHVLLHETVKSSVLWKDVDREWRGNGFHKTNLLRGSDQLKAVAYACKYLLKTNGRVRASQFYGDKDRSQTFYQNKASDEAQRDLSSLSGSPTIPPRTPTLLNSQASSNTTWSNMFTTFRVRGTDLKVPYGTSIPDG